MPFIQKKSKKIKKKSYSVWQKWEYVVTFRGLQERKGVIRGV
jgi:hypothetical protein